MCVYVCIYIYIYICVNIHVCPRMCMYVCMYSCVYVFMCVYACAHCQFTFSIGNALDWGCQGTVENLRLFILKSVSLLLQGTLRRCDSASLSLSVVHDNDTFAILKSFSPAAGGGGGGVSRKRRYCGAGWSSASAMKAWSPARITAGKTEHR